MKAYIIKNDIKIEPFYENSEKLLIKNKSLKKIQKEELKTLNIEAVFLKNNIEIQDDNDYLIIDGAIYFTSELLRDFINLSNQISTPTVCSLKPGIFTNRTIINTQNVTKYKDRIEYKLFYYPSKDKRNKELKAIILNVDDGYENLSLPKHMYEFSNYTIPVTEKVLIQIDHWSNLWVANLMSIFTYLAKLKKISKFRLFLIILRIQSFNKWKIANHLNSIGKNCDIHPTAYVEGSIIGENVTIGAGAIIRESIIGDNCLIGNGVIIEYSVIGNNSSILNGHILFCVLFPGFFSITHAISASIIGKNCFIGSGAVLTDFRLDNKHITVIKNGNKINTGNIILGCCLGNNVYIGSGCIVAPGRSIPNNMHISLDKGKIISKVSEKNHINGFHII